MMNSSLFSWYFQRVSIVNLKRQIINRENMETAGIIAFAADGNAYIM